MAMKFTFTRLFSLKDSLLKNSRHAAVTAWRRVKLLFRNQEFHYFSILLDVSVH